MLHTNALIIVEKNLQPNGFRIQILRTKWTKRHRTAQSKLIFAPSNPFCESRRQEHSSGGSGIICKAVGPTQGSKGHRHCTSKRHSATRTSTQLFARTRKMRLRPQWIARKWSISPRWWVVDGRLVAIYFMFNHNFAVFVSHEKNQVKRLTMGLLRINDQESRPLGEGRPQVAA